MEDHLYFNNRNEFNPSNSRIGGRMIFNVFHRKNQREESRKKVSDQPRSVDPLYRRKMSLRGQNKNGFNCPVPECGRSFTQSTNMHRHRRHVHPDFKLTPQKHGRTRTGRTGQPPAIGRKRCGLCDNIHSSTELLCKHLLEAHGKEKIVVSSKVFETETIYKQWVLEETERGMFLLCKRTTKTDREQLICNRSGKYVSKSQKASKPQSIKLGFDCSAFVNAKFEKDGQVTVKYCLEHYGHDVIEKDLTSQLVDKQELEDRVSIVDHRFGCDYARSSRSHCTKCKGLIDYGSLRLSRRVKSGRVGDVDGFLHCFYHYDCFWPKYGQKTGPHHMKGMESLRRDDYQRILDKIEENNTSTTPSTGSPPTKRRKLNRLVTGDTNPKRKRKTTSASNAESPASTRQKLNPVTRDSSPRQQIPTSTCPRETLFPLEQPISSNREEFMEETEYPLGMLCGLCEETMKNAVLITCCGYSFCLQCIKNKLESSKGKCPKCKKAGNGSALLVPNQNLRKVIEEYPTVRKYIYVYAKKRQHDGTLVAQKSRAFVLS